MKGKSIASLLKKRKIEADVRVVHASQGFDVVIRAPIDEMIALLRVR